MSNLSVTSRRQFLLSSTLALSAALIGPIALKRAGQALADCSQDLDKNLRLRLLPIPYSQVSVWQFAAIHQLEETMTVIMALPTDSLVKPFLTKAGKHSDAKDLGGWYDYSANFDWHTGTKEAERGFAPGHCFGQWMSGLARTYATTGDAAYKNKIENMLEAYEEAISPEFYQDLRFPAYTYDKLLIGLLEADVLANCNSLKALEKTTAAAAPFLPAEAIEREVPISGRDVSYTWDESYTLPENLYLVYANTKDEHYRKLARRFLLDRTLFDPLAAGHNKDVMAGKHAYSYVNALCSAMQAYISDGSAKHLEAAKNGYQILLAQSYATGGWGPDEQLRADDSDDLFKSLSKSHNNFETPCGAYAHLKLTRYLTMVTGESKYADSAERIIHNTILGAKALEKDGSAFYYSDYNGQGKKVFSSHVWPCCAGSLAQVAADYGVNSYLTDALDAISHLYVLQYLDSQVKLQKESPSVLLQSREENIASSTEKITFRLEGKNDQPVQPVQLHLRIPSYPARYSVDFEDNSKADFKADLSSLTPGQFFEITANGRPGSSFSMTITHKLRLEKLNDRHPEMVALMYGPRVLFAVDAFELASRGDLTEAELIAAKRVDENTWSCQLNNGKTMVFKPFTALKDEPYTTYLKIALA